MIEYEVSDGICVLRLSSPPLNTISLDLLKDLTAAVDRANADDDVEAIVITGSPTHFSAGADINLFRKLASPRDAAELSRVFQEAFQHVEDSSKAVAAAVAGKVMGSALELPMACHFRVCAEATTFSMPEVNLGINPGAGGTQRLPRLIGPEAALDMLLSGSPVGADAARDLGLVDAVCPADSLVACATDVIRSGGAPRKTRERTDRVSDAAAVQAALEKAETMLERVNPELVAPSKIAEAVKRGLSDSFEAGLRAEQVVFARCMSTLGTQNKIYVFFATRETGKISEQADAEPRPIARAAVIGMGSMGTGIAHALLIGGVPVVVLDENEDVLRKGTERIADSVRKRVAQGKLSEQRCDRMLGLLSTSTDWANLAQADLVIEAVYEDVEVKRSVARAIEDACGDDTIIATNTSTINLDDIAQGMAHDERLIGMHFFNPAHRMPLVEVIRRETTPNGVIATAMAFAKTIRKTPVLVRNREGFLVNRLFVPYLKEAFWLLEDGAKAADIDRAMAEFGFAMGPLVLIDMAGIDILVHTDGVMSRVFPRHGRVSPIATRLVERGDLGQKTGSGVYKYEKGEYTPYPNDQTETLIAEVQRELGGQPREVDAFEITQRLVLRMLNEAFYVMEEGAVQRASDIDAAMVLGTGFPDFRGGPVKYAQDIGVDNLMMQIRDLEQRFGERFSPARLLEKMEGAQ